MERMQRVEALPFLTVEEAIKRCRKTLKFQEDLGLVIWERARIELVYIRNLKEWISTIGIKLKPNLDTADDKTEDLVLGGLVREADCTIEMHQNFHGLIMSPDGPYRALQRGLGLNRITSNSEEKLLSQIEADFAELNRKRLTIEKDINKRKVNVEKMKSLIIDIEEQLAKRSRITQSRRSSKRVNRKVDNLTNRLSMLRKQIESERSAVNGKEESLTEYLSTVKDAMQHLYKDLTENQKQRLTLIYAQLKKFAVTFTGLNQGFQKRRSEIREMISGLDSVDVCVILERMRRHIEADANNRRNGRIFELQELFSPMRKNHRDRKEKVHSSSAVQKEVRFNPVPITRSANSGMAHAYSAENSLSDNLLVDTFCASSSESLRNKDLSDLSSDSSDFSLGSRIETIVIPSEPVEDLKMPPPFPTRTFCASIVSDKSSYVESPHHEEDLGSKWSNTCQTPRSVRGDVTMMRNIKVVATHDFIASKNDQISFRKGDIIKQKLGENEDGYCYGWIRDSRLAPKQYGWYPAGIVERYLSSATKSTERS